MNDTDSVGECSSLGDNDRVPCPGRRDCSSFHLGLCSDGKFRLTFRDPVFRSYNPCATPRVFSTTGGTCVLRGPVKLFTLLCSVILIQSHESGADEEGDDDDDDIVTLCADDTQCY